MKFNTKFLFAGMTAICLMATACPKDDAKKDDAKKGEVKKDEKKADAKTEEKKPEEKTDAPTEEKAEGGGGEIGIAECDEFLTKVEKCYSNMPGDAAAAGKQGIDAMRTAWKDAAKGPAKDTLADACKQAMEQYKTMPGMGDCFK